MENEEIGDYSPTSNFAAGLSTPIDLRIVAPSFVT